MGFSVEAVNLNAKSAARLLQCACIVNSEVAHGLVARGLRGDVTEKFVISNFDGYFTRNGNLTKKAKGYMKTFINELGLRKNATISSVVKKMAKNFSFVLDDLGCVEKDLRL